ncbi:MAG: energy-coupling factor transporter transmembrane protein EcfT [Coriobacteriaceae bacterium]|nr:energy-coupling factor transporter transmembrane protein EcfT [Coriobacteriaceae bacterium]
MSREPRHTAFSTAHPAVPGAYLVVTLALTMFGMQPVLVAISAAGGLAFGCCVEGPAALASALRWQLPFLLIVAVLNPLFSAAGATELFRLGLRAVYLESVCYGLVMGGLLIASVLWFRAGAALVSREGVLSLMGNALPVIALMISMVMRLIPRFVRQGRAVIAVQDVVGRGRVSRLDAVRGRLRASSVLMGWAMEDSLETADAMRARGWDVPARRTVYARHRFTASDAVALAAIACGGAVAAVLAWLAVSQYRFFPTMSALRPWWGYAVHACWMLVPTVLHVVEERRFA